MIRVNNVFEKISQEKGWVQKVLLGGILMFIPVINLFAMGYLWRYAEKVFNNGDLSLPDWEDWGKLFWAGIMFLIVFLLYGAMLIFLAWLLGLVLSLLSLGMLGWFPFFPVSLAALIAPSLIITGIFSLKNGLNIHKILSAIPEYFKRILKSWQQLLFINLAFLGLILVACPLYGFAFFLGFLFLIPLTTLVLVENSPDIKDILPKKRSKK